MLEIRAGDTEGRLARSLGAGDGAEDLDGPPVRDHGSTPERPSVELAGRGLAAARAISQVRIIAATACTAALPFLHASADRRTLGVALAGGVWLTWAGIVLLLVERPGGGSPLVQWALGAGGDVVALATLGALVPSIAQPVTVAQVLIVAAATLIGGRRAGMSVAAGVLVAMVVSQALVAAPDRLSPTSLVLLGPVLLLVSLLLDQAVAMQLLATSRLAQFEASTEAVLERIADGVVVVGPTGLVRGHNPAAGRILSVEGGVGAPCAAVLGLRLGEHELDCSKGCALVRLAGAGDGRCVDVEVWRPRPSVPGQPARRQPLLASAAEVVEPDGSVVEVVHSFRDLTSVKQAEEAKTLFLATASHELKTPLTVIQGFAQTLLAAPDVAPAVREQALSAISRRAEELNRIVDRLLLGSRIEAGKVSVAVRAVDCNEMVAERVAAVAGATGRDVRLEAPLALPEVSADLEAMATVVDHLLDNAAKYSPAGGSITVGADVRGDRVALWVRDSGIGMDDEAAAHCFDRFWQAESTEGRRFGGTGIGLYIVRSLVEAMGGQIDVDSTAGVGTTFTMLFWQAGRVPLPAPRPTPAPAGAAAAPEPSIVREFMRQIGIATEPEPRTQAGRSA